MDPVAAREFRALVCELRTQTWSTSTFSCSQGVGDELALALERGFQPGQHVVKGVGQFTQLVARAGGGHAGGKVVLRGISGGRDDLVRSPNCPRVSSFKRWPSVVR